MSNSARYKCEHCGKHVWVSLRHIETLHIWRLRHEVRQWKAVAVFLLASLIVVVGFSAWVVM